MWVGLRAAYWRGRANWKWKAAWRASRASRELLNVTSYALRSHSSTTWRHTHTRNHEQPEWPANWITAEKSLSWEANTSFSRSKNIPRKFYCSVHRGVSQINPIHASPFLRSILILSLHLCHDLYYNGYYRSGVEWICLAHVNYECRIISYAYWTVHHLDIWIKVYQLDDTCFIMSIYCSTCFGC